MSVYALAKCIHVPVPRVNDIVLEKRGITADTAIRLARFFGTTEQFWLNLQDASEVSKIKAERAQELARIEPLKTFGSARVSWRFPSFRSQFNERKTSWKEN